MCIKLFRSRTSAAGMEKLCLMWCLKNIESCLPFSFLRKLAFRGENRNRVHLSFFVFVYFFTFYFLERFRVETHKTAFEKSSRQMMLSHIKWKIFFLCWNCIFFPSRWFQYILHDILAFRGDFVITWWKVLWRLSRSTESFHFYVRHQNIEWTFEKASNNQWPNFRTNPLIRLVLLSSIFLFIFLSVSLNIVSKMKKTQRTAKSWGKLPAWKWMKENKENLWK